MVWQSIPILHTRVESQNFRKLVWREPGVWVGEGFGLRFPLAIPKGVAGLCLQQENELP